MQIGSTRHARAAAAARSWLGLTPGAAFHSRRGRAMGETACPLCGAAPAAARRLAQNLEALLAIGAPPPAPLRAVAAARAFAEGNGFLPGQVVDRRA